MSAQTVKVFVSHSSKDGATVSALAGLLRSALHLRSEEIRCTSVDGFRLGAGDRTEESLRREICAAVAFVGVVSERSVASAYVLFEMGARWGASLSLCPVLVAGADTNLLRGPLANYNALRCDRVPEVLQLVADLAKQIGATPEPPESYMDAVAQLVALPPADSKGASEPRQGQRSSVYNAQRKFNSIEEVGIIDLLIEADGSPLTTREISRRLRLSELKVDALIFGLTEGEVVYSLFGYGVEEGHRLTDQGKRLCLELGML